MPVRAPPREALAPLLPLPSTVGIPGGSAKASMGQTQGKGNVPLVRPALSVIRGLPWLLALQNDGPIPTQALHLHHRCSCLERGTFNLDMSQLCLVWHVHPCWSHSSTVPPHHLAAADAAWPPVKSKHFPRACSPWEGSDKLGSERMAHLGTAHQLMLEPLLLNAAQLTEEAQLLTAYEKCPHRRVKNSGGAINLYPLWSPCSPST